MTKYEQIAKSLDEHKGILLLDTGGTLYLLKGYDFEEATIRIWLGKNKVEKFISQIELSNGIVHFYKHGEFNELINRVNNIIADRKRYLKMSLCLSRWGYTIKKK